MSILVYEKRLPHSKNGQWRMAAKYPHTGCMSDPGVTIIVVVVVEYNYILYILLFAVVRVSPLFFGRRNRCFFVFLLWLRENHGPPTVAFCRWRVVSSKTMLSLMVFNTF